ncbi:MAG: tRNA (cytidine/uridine-2'-O-)-methyltransferase [Hyphomicrobiaceae bacterium]
MRIVLVEPEIPQNTGSIARVAAATRTPLDLIKPLGFSLADKYLKRAGLDYWPHVDLTVWDSWEAYSAVEHVGALVAFSARATQKYTERTYGGDERLVFGKETKGLDARVLDVAAGDVWTIPIDNPAVRSLNLSNSVSIVLYEARRQVGV